MEERAFMGMLFHSVPKEEFDFLCAHFPFFAMQYSPDLTVGECLLHIVFFHTVFETPGLGVFLQLIGFPMGTNCAPTWANLVLRFYERLRPLTDMLLFRFIDDGLVLHQPEVKWMRNNSWSVCNDRTPRFCVLALNISTKKQTSLSWIYSL